ncbi:UPL3 [Symbiodinium microadriaticum]|nr:UPL3 [Symbiodinium microadriaticum]
MVLTQDWLMKHALPRNDLFLAKRVLMDRADLTACDRQGNSVLAVAVEHQCSQEMVELLLERGCPRSSKGPLGPPLSIAARSGRLEVVRVLLDFGCDPCEIEASGKLSEAAKNLLGYLVPLPDPVLRRGKEGSLPLRCLRRQLAVETLLPLASSMLPSLQGGQRNLDAQLVQVLVLACEHAAPLPAEALESLVQVCRSLLMSFESSSMNLGLRLASCLCEAGKDGVEKLRRHGIFKMLPALAAAPELHQPPRPQHIRQAAAKILSRWSEEVARSEPTPCLASAERWQELQHLTPSELITLQVPQKLLRDAAFRSAMPKELAPMLLQVVEEEEKFSVHVYRERQDVSLRVLTEPFWLFCRSAATSILQGSTKDVAHGGEYVVQAEPLVTMGSLARLLLVAGGFLATQDYLKFCIRLVGCKVFQGNSMYHVEGVVALPQVGIPVHLLRPCSGECPKGDNGFAPHVLAMGDWRFEDLEECSGASNDSIERNEDVQGLVSDYKEVPAEVLKTSTLQFEPDDEALYLELLRIEAKADVRETFAKLCEQCCVAVVSTEDNEIVDAIAQSVDGMLLHEAAVPLLTQFGWRRRDMEEQDDASFTLWDPPDAAPVLPAFFHLSIRPPPPDPPGLTDTVWSVIISFDAELPFELVWQSVELDVKNAFTSVSNKWSEIGWPGGEQEMLEVVHKAVASNGEAAVARGLTHSSASRIADRLMAAVACRVVAEPEAAQAQGSASRGKGNPKSALRDLVEIKMQDAWMPAVVVQEAPQTLYVSLATGALATGKHRNMPGFEGPRLYPVPPVEPQVQTRADLQALERGAESSRITRRFNVDAECQEGTQTEPAAPAVAPVLTRGAWLPKPTLAYELGGSSSSTSPPSVSLLRGKEVRVDGCSWVSASWTTVGLPELNSSGKVYYELHIESHDTPQIGWASEKFRFFGDTWLYGVGDDLESWGVDGARQKIWHGGEAGSYPSSWGKEVVVGCAADVPAGILQFSTDGVWVSPATFTGVQCASIYPAVSGQMTATFKIRPEEWLHGPPDESFTALSACVRSPQSLCAPVRFPPEWALAKGLQHLAERQKVDLLTTLRLSCSVVLPTVEDLYAAQTKRREDLASPAVEDASDELFDFVLDQDGQPRASEAWEETLDTLGLSAETAAGAALRLLWQADADVQSTRLSAKLQDLCSHQVALVSDSMPSWVLRLGTLMPQLFDRHGREVLLRSLAFGLPFAVHDRQTREVDRRYSEVMKAAEGRVAQAKNLGDQRALSQAYEHLFELTKQISQDPEVWIGSLTSELAKVDRERIWDQATALAECCLTSSGVVEVQFKDETGFGRGVTQGFFSDVAKELQRTSHNSNVPMWAECLESEGEFLRSRRGLMVQPLRAEDPRLPAVLARFRSLGRLLALALRESFVVPLPLAATVLRLLRGEKVVSSELPEPGDGLAGEFLGACARFRADIAELSHEQSADRTMWPAHPGPLRAARAACHKGLSVAQAWWSRLNGTSQNKVLPPVQRLPSAEEQVSTLTAQIQAVRGESAALAEVIRVKDLPLTITQKLSQNEREVKSQVFRAETETARDVALSKLELLDYHSQRGWVVSKTEFDKLESLWSEYSETKSGRAAEIAHSARSSSLWTAEQLSEYLPEFWVLPWCSKIRTQRRSLESLETFLKESLTELPSAVARGDLPGICREESWQEQYLGELENILRVLGCPEGKVNGGRAPFLRLGGLSILGAKEAASRCVIDKLIFPLCAELGVELTLEEYFRTSPVPVSICDYVLRRDGQLLGTLEAKRCSDGLLAQGAAQCILQLLALWDRRRTKTTTHAPLLGIVTDGRYWLCIQLHQRYLAVTPLLDASQEEQFWTLLNFLAVNLSQPQSSAKDPGWAAQYLEASDALGSFEEWASNAEFLATGFSGPSLPTRSESKEEKARHVSLESLDDFVDAACSFWLDVGVREQVRSLRRGLHDVLGPRTGALWLFSPLELRELFCGVDSVSWTSQDLYDHLHPAGGLTRDDDVMAWLRDELLEMSQNKDPG